MSVTSSLFWQGEQPRPTIADARRAIASMTDISQARRRRLNAALSGIALICGANQSQEAAATLDCTYLNERLFARAPASFGFTQRQFDCVVSDTRFIMRRLGIHAPNTRGRLSPAWQELEARLPHYRKIALAGLAGFFSLIGIDPQDVEPGSLARFEHWTGTETLCRDSAKRARETASNWNWAAASVPGWPAVRFERPGMRDTYTPPLTELPVSLQQEVAQYLNRLAAGGDGDLYDDEVALGRRGRSACRPLRRRTIEGKEWRIRVAAGALIRRGLPAEALTSLGLMVQLENVRSIIRFLRERTSKQQSSHLLAVAECLQQIAKYHCRLPQDDVDRLSMLISRVRPPPQVGMTEKNAERLRQIIEPRTRGLLITLPQALARRAREMAMAERDAARLMAYATALEITLRFPFRRANLAALHLDDNLRYAHPQRTLVTAVVIAADDAKSGRPIEWQVPSDCAEFIRSYVSDFRPQLASPANRYLFPGPGLKPRSAHELAIGLCSLIEREIGARINIHLLRHFAGWRYLARHPGHYAVVQRMLGHAKVDTTIRFYAGLEAQIAAQYVDTEFLAERAELAAQAEIDRSLGSPRRSRRRGTSSAKEVSP